ncbi:alpha/beta fold hydrolase [Streptomyces sp. HUCO-GS316]|uniref:alpha/beta fold hydrolase n=1 Tax=Streptomyces sp. HUCO-GS316 TaxID=2692198 RepID=UPI001369F230|nr:alpha/beta hydrolase [Streptomyces sp. HUCO-GS316]MXM66874.1 alpha/beta fold hydrolase [Streptomyces sp. HUCO-GS316]
MSAFVLIPGAGGAAWYWHRVVPELRARGHDAVAVDLPGADQSSGLPEYTDAVVSAIGDRDDVVLVAQSLGAFTAPMVCARAPVGLLVLVNAMVPLPGETPGQWWDNTGWEAARVAAAEKGGYPVEFDLATYFLHDVPAEVAAAGAGQERPEAEVVFGQPCAIDRWPDVSTHVLASAEDRFFPLEFQCRVAHDRLGIPADEIPGGHLVALSRPVEVVERLIGYDP